MFSQTVTDAVMFTQVIATFDSNSTEGANKNSVEAVGFSKMYVGPIDTVSRFGYLV